MDLPARGNKFPVGEFPHFISCHWSIHLNQIQYNPCWTDFVEQRHPSVQSDLVFPMEYRDGSHDIFLVFQEIQITRFVGFFIS